MSGGSVSKQARAVESFAYELLEKCKPRRCHASGRIRLGLAVSGGVDSMALAGLCHRLSREKREIDAFAFIVDHKARPESSSEAQVVQSNLQKLGIESKILTLKWPVTMKDPLQMLNFESAARRMRYRAIAHACQEHGCSSLLLGQHSDDQTETLLMRLASGARGVGLIGIQSEKPIPENFDRFGVNGVGIPMSYADSACDNEEIYTQAGIRVLRPLLPFKKAQLRKFCEEEAIPWVEDLSNFDLTVTKRNAARHLLQSTQQVLPRALQGPSLLRLRERIADRITELELRASEIAERSILERLDLRTGVITVSIPTFLITSDEPPDPQWEETTLNAMTVFLRRVAECISPYETVKLDSVNYLAELLAFTKNPQEFAVLNRLGADNDEHIPEDWVTTGNGSLFWRQSTMAGLLVRHQVHFGGTVCMPMDRAGESYMLSTWQFSRQPFHSKEDSTLVFEPNSPSSSSPNAMSTPLPATAAAGRTPSSEQADWSDFRLWDNRFWIRVRNGTDEEVTIRHLREADIINIRASRKEHFKSKIDKTKASSVEQESSLDLVRQLDEVLEKTKSRYIRSTIPVLARGGQIIAFPTFFPPSTQAGSGLDIDYEIRFRNITPPWRDAGKVTIR